MEFLEEFIVGPVVEEADGTATASGVVYYFSDQLGGAAFVVEVKLIANANLPCGVYEYIPQASLGIEFAEQEDFENYMP